MFPVSEKRLPVAKVPFDAQEQNADQVWKEIDQTEDAEFTESESKGNEELDEGKLTSAAEKEQRRQDTWYIQCICIERSLQTCVWIWFD